MIAREATAEPEGHMVDDKRADIAVARPGMKVVVELKKDTHQDVWNAAQEQLDRFYTRDTEAKGFGIYGVFWFGEKRKKKVPAPPDGVAEPRTATEMARALCGLVPESARSRIFVIVFDVAAPGMGSPASQPTVSAPRRRNSKVPAVSKKPKRIKSKSGTVGRTEHHWARRRSRGLLDFDGGGCRGRTP